MAFKKNKKFISKNFELSDIISIFGVIKVNQHFNHL